MNFKFQISNFKFQILLPLFPILSLLPLSLLFPQPAFADSIDLSLTPQIIELFATSSSTLSTQLQIANNGKQMETMSLGFKEIARIADDGTVTYKATPSANLLELFTLAKDGKRITDSFELRPDETANLTLIFHPFTSFADPNIVFNVSPSTSSASPINSLPLSLIFQTKNETPVLATSSKVEAAVASHILLSILKPSENISDIYSAKLVEFQTQKFASQGSLPFKIILENTGDHFFWAKRKLRLLDVLGKEVASRETEPKLFLAKSTRDLAFDMEPIEIDGLFGKYTAQLTIEILKGKELSSSTSIYIVPKKMLFIGGIILMGIILIYLRLMAFRKRSRESYLARHKGQKKH